ncbi:MAG: SDR family oxidoreductase [Clostridia bacterium]|jgi:short-subunit dehydrogenase
MAVKDRQVVLVTGASRGIGNTIAAFLAKRGHTVYGTSRSPGSKHRMMDEFFQLLSMDNSDVNSIEAVVSTIMEKEGRIDLVVCNAGKTIYGAVENTPPSEGLQQIDVNFMGVARLITAVLPEMRKSRSGTILVMSSMAGRIGLPYNAYYSASKFALEGFIESLRLELINSGIRIALIEPGSVRTGFNPNFAYFAGSSDDVHAKNSANVLRVIAGRAREGINPILIARLVHRLMSRKELRARYSAGLFHQKLALWLKTLFPSRVYENILLKYFKIAENREE